MPLESCPIDEKTLAEYCLGKDRTRLSPEDYARVEVHVAQCPVCQKDRDLYSERANSPMVAQLNPGVDPALIRSTQNVAARFAAAMAVQAKEKAKIEVNRKWRVKAFVIAGVVAIAVAGVFVVLDLMAPPPSQPPSVIQVIQPPSEPAINAENLSTEEKVKLEGEIQRAREMVATAKDAADTSAPEAALAMLEKMRDDAATQPADYAAAAIDALVPLYERLLHRARDTAAETPTALALSRVYLSAGRRPQWLQTFNAYARLRGDEAQPHAGVNAQSAKEAQQAANKAKAKVYFDEVKRLYDEKDYSSSIQLSERLLAQYPNTASAWEGLTVAARGYLANGQPAGSIASYKKIVDNCPDELFAREAARALLKMYLYADQLDNAAEQGRVLRERFVDNDFKAFTFFIEGIACERKGDRYFPAAIKAFREAREAKADSESAKQAALRLEAMQKAMLKKVHVHN